MAHFNPAKIEALRARAERDHRRALVRAIVITVVSFAVIGWVLTLGGRP